MFKSKIRNKYLKIRRIKFHNQSEIKFINIYNLIKKKIKIKNKIIGGYYPINYEINDLEILKELERRKNKIALPKIKKNFGMEFHLWSFSEPLVINKYGIPEPDYNKKIYPDVLLVPLVAFDKNLNRLGYGAGYYDRLIELIKKKKNLLTIGLAFNFQKHKRIPINKYDQKLDFIITNKKIF